jgi:hypothetical protein
MPKSWRIIANGIGYVPPILSYFPEMKDMIRRYALSNLTSLTRDRVHNYLHEVAVPKVHQKNNKKLAEDDLPQLSLEDFLFQYRLKTLSIETTGRWMSYLGFTYTRRKMSYYVDGHEREDVVADRKLFCQRYLNVHEIRTFRWLQLTHEQAKILNVSIEDTSA